MQTLDYADINNKYCIWQENNISFKIDEFVKSTNFEDQGKILLRNYWIPAFAGMTVKRYVGLFTKLSKLVDS